MEYQINSASACSKVNRFAGRFAGAAMLGATVLSTPVLAASNYDFRTVAVTDPNAAPPAGSFAGLGLGSINDAGGVAFYGSTFCNGLNTCAGVFTIDAGGSVTRIINGNGPVFGYPYQTFGDAIINHGGAVSFGVVNFTSASTSEMWLDLWKAGTVRQVVPTRALTSGLPNPYLNARLLNNSKILYADRDSHMLMTAAKGKPPQAAAPGYCTASNATGSSLNGWVVTAGGLAGGSCVSTGYLVTQIPKGTTQLRVTDDGTNGQLSAATVNTAATVAFMGKNLPGRTHVEGLFLQKAGAAVLKLAELDNGACANAPPPSGTCQYRGYANALAISPKGQVLANVLISNWTAGIPTPSNSTGLALNGDALNGQVVWPGMVINGCTVHDVITGPRAINKFGQIVMLLNCTPSIGPNRASQALVVATPVPNP